MRNMAILTATAAIAGLTLVACGTQHPTPLASTTITSPPASPSSPPGPQKFLADVRADFPILAYAPDASILTIGRDECNAFAAGGSYADAVLAFMKAKINKSKPTTTQQATVLIDSAIRNLCPQNSVLLPAGAP